MPPNVETVATDQYLRGLIRLAREHMDLSQAEVAARAGCGKSWYGRIERTKVEVSIKTLLDICDALGITERHLRLLSDGQHHPWDELADRLAERRHFTEVNSPYTDPLEAYLWRSPADAETRLALIAYVRSRRALQVPANPRTEPFADEFERTQR